MLLDALADRDGTPREIVAYNAGIALYAADVAGSIEEGIRLAHAAIGNGSAKRKLDQFVAVTQKLGAKQ
jgi:anthranilate phosphoribosyltransferase